MQRDVNPEEEKVEDVKVRKGGGNTEERRERRKTPLMYHWAKRLEGNRNVIIHILLRLTGAFTNTSQQLFWNHTGFQVGAFPSYPLCQRETWAGLRQNIKRQTKCVIVAIVRNRACVGFCIIQVPQNLAEELIEISDCNKDHRLQHLWKKTGGFWCTQNI